MERRNKWNFVGPDYILFLYLRAGDDDVLTFENSSCKLRFVCLSRGGILVVECLPIMREALGLILSTKQKN
jgi:hypothetical protein